MGATIILLKILLFISIAINILGYLILSKKYKTNLDKLLNSTTKSFKGKRISILQNENDETEEVVFKGCTDIIFTNSYGTTEKFRNVRSMKIDTAPYKIKIVLVNGDEEVFFKHDLKSYEIIQYTQKTTKITVAI